MDGFKKRLKESLQFKLSFSLSVAILVIALLAGVFSFLSAFQEANELQDDTLRQVAALFDRQVLAPHREGDHALAPAMDEETRVVVQHLTDGDHMRGKGDAESVLPLPSKLPDGLQTVEIEGETFRVLVKTTLLGERIAVAQETGVRDDIASDSALRTLMPFLILVPILLLLVADLVRKMFLPIASLSSRLDQRAEDDLQPVPQDDLPSEVRPFAAAINRLLGRVGASMQVQRRFVADAAHELRSPLTALSLQAERLAATPMSGQAQERLDALRRGIERGRQLLEQLLALAKAQSEPDATKAALSVRQVYRTVLEDLLPLAEAKHIDIGLEGARDATVWTHEFDLVTVVKNLVDNAIRYTPCGGRVDLSVTAEEGRAVLRIKDSGPGIQVAERERVFDPFYRTLGSDQVGSGLGLSIVKAVADRMGAEIQLGFSDEVAQSGLCVRVLVPLNHVGSIPT